MANASTERLRPHNCHFSENTLNALRAKAWDLQLSGSDGGVSGLVRDVVEGWLASTTNFNDPIFHRGIEIAAVVMPKERYPGYRKDLGFEE